MTTGSRYAFHPEHDKEDLRTVTYDNDGIGIMTLAGNGVCKRKEGAAIAAPSALHASTAEITKHAER